MAEAAKKLVIPRKTFPLREISRQSPGEIVQLAEVVKVMLLDIDQITRHNRLALANTLSATMKRKAAMEEKVREGLPTLEMKYFDWRNSFTDQVRKHSLNAPQAVSFQRAKFIRKKDQQISLGGSYLRLEQYPDSMKPPETPLTLAEATTEIDSIRDQIRSLVEQDLELDPTGEIFHIDPSTKIEERAPEITTDIDPIINPPENEKNTFTDEKIAIIRILLEEGTQKGIALSRKAIAKHLGIEDETVLTKKLGELRASLQRSEGTTTTICTEINPTKKTDCGYYLDSEEKRFESGRSRQKPPEPEEAPTEAPIEPLDKKQATVLKRILTHARQGIVSRTGEVFPVIYECLVASIGDRNPKSITPEHCKKAYMEKYPDGREPSLRAFHDRLVAMQKECEERHKFKLLRDGNRWQPYPLEDPEEYSELLKEIDNLEKERERIKLTKDDREMVMDGLRHMLSKSTEILPQIFEFMFTRAISNQSFRIAELMDHLKIPEEERTNTHQIIHTLFKTIIRCNRQATEEGRESILGFTVAEESPQQYILRKTETYKKSDIPYAFNYATWPIKAEEDVIAANQEIFNRVMQRRCKPNSMIYQAFKILMRYSRAGYAIPKAVLEEKLRQIPGNEDKEINGKTLLTNIKADIAKNHPEIELRQYNRKTSYITLRAEFAHLAEPYDEAGNPEEIDEIKIYLEEIEKMEARIEEIQNGLTTITAPHTTWEHPLKLAKTAVADTKTHLQNHLEAIYTGEDIDPPKEPIPETLEKIDLSLKELENFVETYKHTAIKRWITEQRKTIDEFNELITSLRGRASTLSERRYPVERLIDQTESEIDVFEGLANEISIRMATTSPTRWREVTAENKRRMEQYKKQITETIAKITRILDQQTQKIKRTAILPSTTKLDLSLVEDLLRPFIAHQTQETQKTREILNDVYRYARLTVNNLAVNHVTINHKNKTTSTLEEARTWLAENCPPIQIVPYTNGTNYIQVDKDQAEEFLRTKQLKEEPSMTIPRNLETAEDPNTPDTPNEDEDEDEEPEITKLSIREVDIPEVDEF